MTSDLATKIADWLKTQGYPLEMEVAHIFKGAGFDVSSSEYYVDPEEQKPREIDVLASLSTQIHGLLFQVTYVVECKSPKEAPWVCFRSNANPPRDPKVGFLVRIATREGRRALIELSVNPDVTTSHLLQLPEQHAYGVTNALREGNKDAPYGALRGATGAARALVAYSDKAQTPPEPIGYVGILFPLVVTRAPLFTASLDSGGELKLQAVDQETVLRTGFDTEYSVVEVVTASTLAQYVDARADLIARFLKRLPSRIPNTLQELGYANLAADGD